MYFRLLTKLIGSITTRNGSYINMNHEPGHYFEEFLAQQDICEATTEQAVKWVLAYQLSTEIKNQSVDYPGKSAQRP